MNGMILRLAIPSMVSNVAVPLMGLVSTAIAGRCGNASESIGTLAVGVAIFNFIYWNCSFLRLGTSGLAAQAFGASDFRQTTLTLLRTVFVAVILGIVLVTLRRPVCSLSVRLMNGNDGVAEYFLARVWAVPAGIMLFGIYGWLNGMQNAVIPMWTSIFVNVVHAVMSVWFVFGHGMGVAGIAWGSVVAQWCGLMLILVLTIVRFRHTLRRVAWHEIVDVSELGRFFRVNADIIVRSLCLCLVYTFFTAASAGFGPDVLAVNSMLLQLFTLFSYMSDGFAYAVEALTGRYTGARDKDSLRSCIRRSMVWMSLTAVLAIGVYVGFWRELILIFVGSDADPVELLAMAHRYLGWIIVVPLVAAIPFLFDGIMVGATMTAIMRRSMIVSTVIFFVLFYSLKTAMGNDAIWLAFSSFMLVRGVLQYFMSHHLRDVYNL